MTLVEIMIVMAIVAILAAVSIGAYQDYRDRARNAQAASDITAISLNISRYFVDNRSLPHSLADIGHGGTLDPWGQTYFYVDLTSATGANQARKDKKLHPINTDYDLYSAGKDGQTRLPLTAAVSRDDVVRARDGKFIGLASDFDP